MLDMEINSEAITIYDCLDMYQKKSMVTILKDGHIVGFEEDKDKYDGE